MVIGASWNGARAFTSTAGPGISLMNELLGLAYYAEIPAVIIDVQRVGPSTGMPTRTQQGDILECAYASHGDTKHILLFPSNPAECFEFAPKAFDLAERFQTPVFMLSDLDIGMNDWVVPRLKWDDSLPARSRPRSERRKISKRSRNSSAITGEDENQVAPRTLPGVHPKGVVLHARLRPQQIRRLHRNARRVSGSDGPPAAQAQGRGEIRARADHPAPRRRELRRHHPRRLRSGRARSAGSCWPNTASTADFMRMRGFPFDDSRGVVPRRHTSSASSSSRIATPSSALS